MFKEKLFQTIETFVKKQMAVLLFSSFSFSFPFFLLFFFLSSFSLLSLFLLSSSSLPPLPHSFLSLPLSLLSLYLFFPFSSSLSSPSLFSFLSMQIHPYKAMVISLSGGVDSMVLAQVVCALGKKYKFVLFYCFVLFYFILFYFFFLFMIQLISFSFYLLGMKLIQSTLIMEIALKVVLILSLSFFSLNTLNNNKKILKKNSFLFII